MFQRIRSTGSTIRFYVMLMPDDNYMVREEGDNILTTEQLALDCWAVEATSKEHALGIVFHKLYNQVRRQPAPSYTDPNARAVHDTINCAMADDIARKRKGALDKLPPND